MTNFQNFALSHTINSLNKSKSAISQNAKYYIRDNNRIQLVINPNQSSLDVMDDLLGESYSFYFNPEFVADGINLIAEDSNIQPLEIRSELTQIFPIGSSIIAALDAVEAANAAHQ